MLGRISWVLLEPQIPITKTRNHEKERIFENLSLISDFLSFVFS